MPPPPPPSPGAFPRGSLGVLWSEDEGAAAAWMSVSRVCPPASPLQRVLSVVLPVCLVESSAEHLVLS